MIDSTIIQQIRGVINRNIKPELRNLIGDQIESEATFQAHKYMCKNNLASLEPVTLGAIVRYAKFYAYNCYFGRPRTEKRLWKARLENCSFEFFGSHAEADKVLVDRRHPFELTGDVDDELDSKLSILTDLEQMVVKGLLSCRTGQKEIAAELGVSQTTVSNILIRSLKKLGLTNFNYREHLKRYKDSK